jgi:nicotinamidase-related amidase
VRKTHGSSFEATVLGDELARRSVSQVVVCGLATHACVKATTLAAIELGYKTTVAKDAHSNSSKDAARLIDEWNQKLGAAGARGMATQEITFE